MYVFRNRTRRIKCNHQDLRIGEYYYDAQEECLYLDNHSDMNRVPSILGITPAMWNFTIGCIPQLDQFLASRQYSPARKWNTLQRAVNPQEIDAFLRICGAIRKTISLLPQIDALYQQIDTIPESE